MRFVKVMTTLHHNVLFRRLSVKARLLFYVAMEVTADLDQAGALRARVAGALTDAEIAHEAALPVEDVTEALGELVALGFFTREADGAYVIARFAEKTISDRSNAERQARFRQREPLRNGVTLPLLQTTALSVVERDGGVCSACGTAELLTLVPLRQNPKGGIDQPSNLALMCENCRQATKKTAFEVEGDRYVTALLDRNADRLPKRLGNTVDDRDKISETKKSEKESPSRNGSATHRDAEKARPLTEPFGLADWLWQQAYDRDLIGAPKVPKRNADVVRDTKAAKQLLDTAPLSDIQERAMRFLDGIQGGKDFSPTCAMLLKAWDYAWVKRGTPKGKTLHGYVRGKRATCVMGKEPVGWSDRPDRSVAREEVWPEHERMVNA